MGLYDERRARLAGRRLHVLQRVARGLELGAKALAYLAAGVLRPADLGWAIARRWQDFGKEDSHVLSDLMPWEHEFYSRFLKPEDDILVVGRRLRGRCS